MTKRKHLDAKQFFIGVAITLVVWAIGILASGRIFFLLDYLYVSNGNKILSLVYPFLLVAFSVSFAVICKKKSKDTVFLGTYLLLVIPTALFVFTQIYSLLDFDFLDIVGFLWLPIIVLAIPATSVFDGFFVAYYGNSRPVGFSDAHLIFCIIMTIVAVLPPIVYKLIKKQSEFQ